ncbi:hypothetical protein [Candidatus Methanomassiliicoccus intestinalis]|uniref:hypothetical protein n=1 Tax=Candidatus Methanomassiliicoccus intestinalis TaxID=1406512 RepID=UPI0037DC95CB
MVYQIPSEGRLAIAIADVLRQHDVITSQSKLVDLTRERLKEMNPEYTVTAERVRRVAIQSGVAAVEIKTRELASQKPSAECPVCGSKMRKIKNKTLYGKAITLRYKCTKCKYSTGMSKSIPVRYSFKYALSKEKSDDFYATILRF